MKKIVLTFLFITTIFAQDIISVNVSGNGITKDQAVQSALRNAIEQAYGAFISSNTEFLNDKLIKDKITSLAQGNILGYDILSVSKSNSNVVVFLSAQVSLTKLAQFAQSKGESVSVNSNIVYMNAIKEDFYEKNELIILEDYIASYKYIQLFDYSLEASNPVRYSHKDYPTNNYYETPLNREMNSIVKDSTRKESWVYSLSVTISANNNYKEFYNGLIKLLESISIDENTAIFRQDSGLDVGKLSLITTKRKSKRFYGQKFILPKDYYFRNKGTIGYLEGTNQKATGFRRHPSSPSFDDCSFRGRIHLDYFMNIHYQPYYDANYTLERTGLSCFILDKMSDFELYYKTPQKFVQLNDLNFSQESNVENIEKSKNKNNSLDWKLLRGSIPSRIFLNNNVTYYTYKIFSPYIFKNVTGFEIRPKY